MKWLAIALLVFSPALPLCAQEPASAATADRPAPVEIFDAEVVATYPHDPHAFTEGLLWHDGALYESTGTEGRSQVRRVALETGEVLESRDIPADQFGEGLALLDGQFTSLTWTSGVAHRWSASGLKPQGNAPYPYEGWGLTAMDGALVASDGSATLRFLDPQTFALLREITVTINGSPIRRINELEMVDGLIYANVWFTGFILGIDPQTGAVRRVVDLRPLVETMPVTDRDAVLNGIAYDPAGKRLFVTGKLWPSLFEIRLVPRTG